MKSFYSKIARFAVAVPATVMSFAIVSIAAADATNQPPPKGPASQSDLSKVLCNITAYFFWIVITVSVIMILYAAMTYATAGSDTEKTSKARRTITYAAVGIAVALLAYGFPAIVGSLFPSVSPSVSLSYSCCEGSSCG